MKRSISIFLLLYMGFCHAQMQDSIAVSTQSIQINDGVTYTYQKPKFLDIFKNIPNDLVALGNFTIQKENLKWDAIVLGSTIALLPVDQNIVDESQRIGNRIGGWDEPSTYKRVFGIEMFPTSTSSAVYFIGTGNTTLLLSGFFYAVGKIGPDDYRALNTSSELVEVLLSVGVATQTIKRITGRQSPIAATQDGGAWQPFPSFSAFASNTPNYDAMPSGHMATYMATITVIAQNYPELKWIKPVGYSLGAALAFNMMSGQVHWASDYPIGILIGYVIGKNAADRRITKSTKVTNLIPNQTKYKTSYNYNRINDTNLIGMTITF
ncbi:MAG: phosphatase PAP2 family protein [Flavobacterium sp.]|nr:phosphatase PAP2 family protein [Flavobacterium sp.]